MVTQGQEIMLEWAGVYMARKTGRRDSPKAHSSDGNPELPLVTREGHTVMLQGPRWEILKCFLNGLNFSILMFSKQTR